MTEAQAHGFMKFESHHFILRRYSAAVAALGPYAIIGALLPIAGLLLCSCDFAPRPNPFSREITDKSGTNRLALIYLSSGPGPVSNSESFDFHSLVWRTKAGTNWSDRVVITKTDFEQGHPRQRHLQSGPDHRQCGDKGCRDFSTTDQWRQGFHHLRVFVARVESEH